MVVTGCDWWIIVTLALLLNDEQAEWVNRGGDDTVAVVHPECTKMASGNTMMAATVCATVIQVVGAKVLEEKVFLTGGDSRVGKAVALYLVNKGFEVVCCCKSDEDFNNIKSKVLDTATGSLSRTDTLAGGAAIGTWIIGEYDPEVNDHMPSRAEAVVFSVPDPVNQRHRPDVQVTPGEYWHKHMWTHSACRIITWNQWE